MQLGPGAIALVAQHLERAGGTGDGDFDVSHDPLFLRVVSFARAVRNYTPALNGVASAPVWVIAPFTSQVLGAISSTSIVSPSDTEPVVDRLRVIVSLFVATVPLFAAI